jgi:hypothetical protein
MTRRRAVTKTEIVIALALILVTIGVALKQAARSVQDAEAKRGAVPAARP